jgi:hypothetical protein
VEGYGEVVVGVFVVERRGGGGEVAEEGSRGWEGVEC